MGLKQLAKNYKVRENKEFARRAAKRKQLRAYKGLKNTKPTTVSKVKKALKGKKFSKKKFTKALGNPYGVRL